MGSIKWYSSTLLTLFAALSTMVNIKLFARLLYFILYFNLIFTDSGEVYYVGEFTDDIKDCDGFENDVFKCNDMNIGFVEGTEERESGLGLSGKLDILKEILDDYMINLKVWKETDLGKEFMYSVGGNLCDSISKNDTPWWPLVESFNKTSCPIAANIYPVQDMVLTLDFAKDVLRHELCGDYAIELSITDGMEQPLSCHLIPACILEKVRE